MACDGSNEKETSVAFEKLPITSSDQTSSQTINDSEYSPPVQSQILSAIRKIIKKMLNVEADVKAITKKINKTSGTRFDEGCIAVNISQLLDKKIITNVKTPQLDSFHLSTTEISSEDNLPSQVEEIILDDTQQCQQNTHFIRILLDDIINNALGNLDKSSEETKITIRHTNEMSTFAQQSTSDDTLIPIPNGIHTAITKNCRISKSTSSFDEGFQKLELKIYELNKSVNSELALLNRRLDSVSDYFNKLVNSSLPSQNEKSLEENISLLKKNLCMKEEIIKKLVETQNTVLNTISAKSNNQHSNILNQSSSSLPSKNLNENSHNTKKLTSQEPQDPPVARTYSSQLQKISHLNQAHHQRPEQNIAVKNIYVGNLPEDITKQDICELLGLNSRSYLRDTCNIDLPINNKTGKFKGFAFIRAPAHITDELIKLDGIAYHDNELRVEDATSTRKRTSNNISYKSRRPSVVVNNYPENQHSYGIFSL